MWVSDGRTSLGGNSKGIGLAAGTCMACLRNKPVRNSWCGWSRVNRRRVVGDNSRELEKRIGQYKRLWYLLLVRWKGTEGICTKE